MRAERSIGKSLQSADSHPFVTPATRRDCISKSLPLPDRSHRVNARDESSIVMCALERSEIVERPHVDDRRYSTRRDVTHCRVERAIVEHSGRRRLYAIYEICCVVF